MTITMSVPSKAARLGELREELIEVRRYFEKKGVPVEKSDSVSIVIEDGRLYFEWTEEA